jgi:hypothetical protein
VACVPAFADPTGLSLGAGPALQRGASMATDMHVDGAPPTLLGDDSDGDGDVPEGAVRFELTAAEIEAALAEPSLEVDAPDDVDVPDTLVPEEAVAELMGRLQPHFVPIPGRADAATTPPPAASSGVPLATAARAFASPAAVDEAPPPPTPWKLLTPPVVAFEFDLASPPACGAERVVEVAATAAGAATAVAAWVRLGHAGGSTWSSGLDDGAEREEGDGAGESVWGG